MAASSDENAAASAKQQAASRGQIPIVCPGHTRPLAEVQFCHVKEENRTFLVSACHGTNCFGWLCVEDFHLIVFCASLYFDF